MPAPGANDGGDRSWRGRAACRGSGELFFAPNSDDGPARGWSAEQAKAVCGSCPVRAECRAWAVLTRQQDGVWGGLDEDRAAPAAAPPPGPGGKGVMSGRAASVGDGRTRECR